MSPFGATARLVGLYLGSLPSAPGLYASDCDGYPIDHTSSPFSVAFTTTPRLVSHRYRYSVEPSLRMCRPCAPPLNSLPQDLTNLPFWSNTTMESELSLAAFTVWCM